MGPLIPKAIIETHGAFGCGLSFAKGPIELAVIDMQSSKAQLLKSFSRALLNFPTHFCNLTISSGVIGGAKCPLVKFKSVAFQVNFEIVFNRPELLKEKECLLENLAEFPDLKYHMYYMIIFLRQRDLDNPIHGGLGVFLLTCMVAGFVKYLHKRNLAARGPLEVRNTLLSETCLRMLEFFGLHFDCSKQKINISHVGDTIVDKPVPNKDSNFSMTVPSVYGEKDIGLAAHRAKEVYNCLKSRYFFMTNYNYLNGESVLKHLVNPSRVDFMKYLI